MKKYLSIFIILITSISIARAENPFQFLKNLVQPLINQSKPLMQIPANPQNKPSVAEQAKETQQPSDQIQPHMTLQIPFLWQKPTQAVQSPAIPRIPLEQTEPLMQPGLLTPYLFQATSPIQQGQPSQPTTHDPSKGIYYFVDYDPSSNMKDIPLKNMKMKIEVYYYGNPEGRLDVVTDDNQTFNIEPHKDTQSLMLEVLSIADQEKYKARCSGLVTPGFTKVMIKCNPTKKI